MVIFISLITLYKTYYNCINIKWWQLSMLPHFSYMSTKAFYQTVHYLAAIAKTLKQTCLWTSYGCLEKIYQSIMVSNSIDKAVNCFKKCLKEMWSHGDGMPWQSIAICLSWHSLWHSITMRPHFFEAFFQIVHYLFYATTFFIHVYQSILSNSSTPSCYG